MSLTNPQIAEHFQELADLLEQLEVQLELLRLLPACEPSQYARRAPVSGCRGASVRAAQTAGAAGPP